MAGDWIKRLADDERKRDDARLRETEAAALKANLVRVHGRRLIEDLRAAVARDIEAFRQEFAGDQARAIVFEDVQTEGGFVVGKAEYPAVSLDVLPRLEAAAVSCHYRFTPNSSLPPREDRLDLVFVPYRRDSEDALQLKHRASGQAFTTADALSEYLLAPVFTGRPR